MYNHNLSSDTSAAFSKRNSKDAGYLTFISILLLYSDFPAESQSETTYEILQENPLLLNSFRGKGRNCYRVDGKIKTTKNI